MTLAGLRTGKFYQAHVPETVGFYLYGPFSLPWRLLPWGVLRRLDERLASPRNSGRRAV